MLLMPGGKLTRIAVFYDGGYFSAVSDYYLFCHERKQRLSVPGLHDFIKHQVAESEGVDPRYCQVVDAHYFRGRFSAQESQQAGKLFSDRAFDDVLMRAGVVTHYLPRTERGEKGIDVWLALEAFELAVYKRFDVLVLVVCDGDYLPLVRKVNTLGTRVMLLAWDFDEKDPTGRQHSTRVAQALLDEVTYPVQMHTIIDDRTRRHDPLIANLFLPKSTEQAREAPGPASVPQPVPQGTATIGEQRKGRIKRIPEGATYGYIEDEEPSRPDWFFIANNVRTPAFQELKVGDEVSFVVAANPRGGLWAVNVEKV